ncbi:hypothetical protein OU800_21970 [Pseudomonas sp. GOM7]|uniref:hypothetical protein n=1 Tax=Pseudomonas sp. GOM7 TaxID=2998079 RepID=UPI00227A4B13|nr:hypothetical protein [Pseudomonas sp. GOM7]WAJ37243.1 hypothetical protein OU800_21970 [Pseudomonas sp. GOM7]
MTLNNALSLPSNELHLVQSILDEAIAMHTDPIAIRDQVIDVLQLNLQQSKEFVLERFGGIVDELIKNADDEECLPVYRGTGDAAVIKRKIEALYAVAAKTYSTYETMVQSSFSEAVRNEFGEDENANPDVAYAFAYARDAFGYLSSEELEQENAEAAKEGICQHGLTSSTCPCGCFEYEPE